MTPGALLFLLLAAPAGAQGADDPPADLVVVGVAVPDQDARVPSAFLTVLTPEDRPGAPPDVVDLIEGAPGTHVRRAGGTGRAAFLQVRGASAHQVALYLDDLPLDSGRGGAVDLSSIPAALIARAELIRGVASAAYGSGAQGGVLRLVTRPPPLGTVADARLRTGTVGSVRLDGAIGVGDGDAALLAVAQGSAAEGDFPYSDVNGNRRARRNNQHARGSGLLTGHLDLGGARGRLSALVEGTAGVRGEPGVEQFERLDSASARQRIQGAVGWRSALGAPLALQVLAFGRVEAYRFQDPDPLFDGPTAFTLDDHSAGLRARGAGALGDHRLALAGELRHEGARTHAEGSALDARPDRSESRLRGALIASDVFTPHRRLALSAALRLDGNTERALAWVPHVGAALHVAGGLHVRGNLGRLLRDPGFDERFFVGQGVRGDPGLRSETGWGADLGLQWAARRWSAELVGFAQRYDRLILFAPLGAYRVQAQDRFGADALGVEARLAGLYGPWQGSLTWTGLDARLSTAPHAALPYRPAHRVDAQLAAHVDAARIYGRVSWRSAVFVDTFESRALPSYGTVDLGVDGALGRGLSVGVEARNLGDAQGLDTAQQPLPGRRWFVTLGWHAGR